MPRAVLNLAEQVYHQHVTGPEGVDDPGVLPARAAIAFTLILHDRIEIRSVGDHAYGYGPPDEDAVWMQVVPTALELEVIVMVTLDNAPGFVIRHRTHTSEYVVWHVRPAVGQAVAGEGFRERGYPFRRVEDHASRVPSCLCVG
jgi:hypothetical protein